MITREEAQDKLNKQCFFNVAPHPCDFIRVENIIEAIYASIGSCGQCRHNVIIKDELWCHTYQAPTTDKNFCSFFEEKTNDLQ